MTIAQLQQEFLSSDSQKIAPEDFFVLLAHATKKEKAFLLGYPEYSLATADEALARELFRQRRAHEPVALIVGRKEFYGYGFKVTESTLIPRPETELLVELSLKAIESCAENPISFFDIGTGSGCIVLSVAKTLAEKHSALFSRTTFIATDISPAALTVAEENARTHQLKKHITFLQGDLLTPCLPHIKQNHEIVIVANLPYLSNAIYANTAKDVRDYEPQSALVSGQNGLDHYYRLLESVKSLRPRKQPITLLLEISPEQTPALRSFMLGIFPDAKIRIHEDLAGKERAVEVHIP